MKFLTIIPAYNEQESIGQLISDLREFGSGFIKKDEIDKFDILIVNDNSKDHTLSLAKKHNEVLVLDLPVNLGIGGAVQAGYVFAQRNNYDYAIQVDGDGQHSPIYINDLYSVLRTHNPDMVIGSRYVLCKDDNFHSTPMRRLGKNLISMLIKALHGKVITDPTSGFRIVNRKLINFFSDYYPYDYPEPESLALCLRHGFSVYEVPVKMKERIGGRSSISNVKSAYYMIKVFISILVDYFKPRQVKYDL
ncbi:MAG: glycosyltransferase family 2 protein [Proteobacteria bacterium]|nr:glycosyltransferase family 2 protein [Pseudomonadota bacterium]